MNEKVIALAGNPNVGKTTVFNALTGMKHHTGNWAGKTIEGAEGKFKYKDIEYILVDLPGTYSLAANSTEEEIAGDFICHGNHSGVVVVVDATCIERNLNLVLQILKCTKNVVVCVNLLDEAEKKKIHIDIEKLSLLLNVPVQGVSARSKKGLDLLCEKIHIMAQSEQVTNSSSISNTDEEIFEIFADAEEICRQTVFFEKENYDEKDRKIDKILTSKLTGIPLMLLFLGFILWLTIAGANYPSEMLANLFAIFETNIAVFFNTINIPPILTEIVVFGILRTLFWVVSVMLPPMAIFFPLFTILEDVGYLPRIAFNLDKYFKKAGAHGKQALTTCMGFGCNACGVMGCRIIDSPRERLIAILTNNFTPCNGRFPTLIAIISMFFISSALGAAGILLGIIVLGIFATLFVSFVLTKTILKGTPSGFVLELPPYRMPKIGSVIFRSIFDRTLFVLGRAVCIAAPAGLIIWLLANIHIGAGSLLFYITGFFDPFASLFGLDGVILVAFCLALPANEILFPIIIMCYLSSTTLLDVNGLDALKSLLLDNGWTIKTALCTAVFSLMHFPCATTLWTIQKETKSIKYTFLAFIIPTIFGLSVCFLLNLVFKFFIS